MEKYIKYYLLSLFMLANGSLFTWLFRGTPLAAWRQLIWIAGLGLLFKYYKKIDLSVMVKVINLHFYLFIVILLQACLSVAFYNFNLVRIFYAFWFYFSGLPFLLLPYIIARTQCMKATTFYNIFIGLGIFLTLGLIIDFISGGFFTKMFLVSVSSSLEGLLSDARFCFLSEAPTTFGTYYSFCLFCTLYRLYLAKDNLVKLGLLICSLFYIVGGWLTGSRQIVLVLLLVFVLSFAYYCFCVRDKKMFVLFAISIVVLVYPAIHTFMYSDQAYKNRYSANSIQKDSRTNVWIRGWHETVTDDIRVFLFGKAVGLAQGQKAQKGEVTGSHYENTYFSRLSEIGICGVFLLIMPLVYLWKYWIRTTVFNIFLLAFFLSYLVICYVSPNGSHQTTQMAVYIAFGLFLNRHYFDKDIVDNI